ncbi:hypothetical protein [Paracraurococcus ruber]|uniref:Uncharacterized protein n=1 Tax=Paracraurococcus ruber TaxID=77675 RepID=A0ABS1D667_9PROT|nr:hypothetical protein [Paracraurococcus ruber]MBK1661762.1 hypothetical protein [Paracraurococcus ruber]TDG23870.1 hypothetical protein E2C05_26350 [Paracraurococcus ruber]
MRILTLLLCSLLPAAGMAGVLAAASLVPEDGAPMLAAFADDAAALRGADLAEARIIALPRPGWVAVDGMPGLAGRLRQAGAHWVVAHAALLPCGPAGR